MEKLTNISELEDLAVETIKNATEKTFKQQIQSLSNLWDNIKKLNKCAIEIFKEEVNRGMKK